MRLIRWIGGVFVAVLLILFAVSNRTTVPLRIEPLPYLIEAPLYAALLLSLIVGFVLGGIAAWLGARKWRRRARAAERECERAKSDLAEARKQALAAGPKAPSSPAAAEPPRLPYAS
ncbi:MAG TPA: LapA family protein [Alphaproteobacteria bacterium]|nr:LapA family protein [Alphaproteobacteria bacterium]